MSNVLGSYLPIYSMAVIIVMVAASASIRFVTKRMCKDGKGWSWMGSAWRSVRWSVHVLIWLTGGRWLAKAWIYKLLPVAQADAWTVIVNRAYAVGIILAVVLFAFNLLRQIDNFVEERAKGKKGSQLPDHVHSITRVMRLAVLAVALLSVISALGYDISSLLLAGGVGGIVLGFAAKDMLANTFGTLTIYLDRPFVVGDMIEVQGKDIMGKVEAITMRLTKIRNFDRQPVYVPNVTFSQGIIVNRTRMTHRRIDEYIGVRYQDMASVKKVAADIQAMLDAHPRIDSDESCIANMTRFGASSVDIHIYVFALSTDWSEFNAIKQDILMKAAEIVAENGAEFAYPTQTLHVQSYVKEP